MYFTNKEIEAINKLYPDSFRCNGFNTKITPSQCKLRQENFNCKKKECGYDGRGSIYDSGNTTVDIHNVGIRRLNLKRRKQ